MKFPLLEVCAYAALTLLGLLVFVFWDNTGLIIGPMWWGMGLFLFCLRLDDYWTEKERHTGPSREVKTAWDKILRDK